MTAAGSNGPREDALVHLVVPPYAPLEHPSLGVGVLKAALARSGIPSSVSYLNLRHAEAIGLPRNLYVGALAPILIGEWTFARAAFPDAPRDDDGYFALAYSVLRSRWSEIEVKTAIRMMLESRDLSAAAFEIREAAEQLILEAADEIVERRPRIVGCSSVFQQHCASLALLRRIRELAPDIVTVIGGSNCEGPMGRANLENFPWLDFVVSGEADFSFPELCRQILDRGPDLEPAQVPRGVYSRAGGLCTGPGGPPAPENRHPIVRGLVHDLDATPIPDLGDYFEQLEQHDLAAYIEPSLLIETSRGCWWGEHSHCTFCGLNGTGMGYRSKSPERTVLEFEELARRHATRRFAAVDNILDMKYFDSVLPRLGQADDRYVLFFETKPNLTREHLRKLRAAGVHAIQPGIESLHDVPLSKMGKGNRVTTNLQLLKWAREVGVYVTWFILSGLPDDDDRWYAEMAELTPLLTHLCPPRGIGDIQWHRFSPYFERAGDFGLDLEPTRASRFIYPLEGGALVDINYSFDTIGAVPRRRPDPLRPGRERLDLAVRQWQQEWETGRAALTLIETEDGLRVEDGRRCAVDSVHLLRGLDADVYRACDTAQARNGLLRRLTGEEAQPLDWEGTVLPSLEGLVERRLMLCTGSHYLSLAHNRPLHPTGSWSGHGIIDLDSYLADRQAEMPLRQLFHA